MQALLSLKGIDAVDYCTLSLNNVTVIWQIRKYFTRNIKMILTLSKLIDFRFCLLMQ